MATYTLEIVKGYSHELDPQTGLPRRSAAVVADLAMQARSDSIPDHPDPAPTRKEWAAAAKTVDYLLREAFVTERAGVTWSVSVSDLTGMIAEAMAKARTGGDDFTKAVISRMSK
jgi:hypothetical protein